MKKLIYAYIAIAALTFGFAFNKEYPSEQGLHDGDRATMAVSGAALCGAGWPLYLSTKLFTHYKPKVNP